MQPSAPATLTAEAARTTMNAAAETMRSWLDRMLSVGYGVVFDYVYPRFSHYQRLQAEVRDLVEAAVPARVERRDVRVLELACGPGNFTCALAEAGFSAEEIARIHSPIGLNIGAQSPQEIAISIMAELVLALRGPKVYRPADAPRT